MTSDKVPTRSEAEEMLKAIQGQQELTEMAMKEMSKLYRVRYSSLVETGLTEEQAFKIVLTRGIQ